MHSTQAFEFLLALLFLSGCGVFGALTEAHEIRLETLRQSYAAADTVSLRLTNGTRQPLERPMCPPMLYEWTGESWMKPDEWDSDINNDGIETGCILLAYGVSPRSVDIYKVLLPVDLRPGQYRFEENLTSRDRSVDTLIYTPPFVVE